MDNGQSSLFNSKWLTLLVVVSGLFVVALDMSIVNLAISKMMLTFNATLDQIQWVLSAYTLALGITMPMSGYLSDTFGIKRVFILSLALFTLGSFLCGMSWNTLSVIAFRVIQGLAGGLIMPLSMTILMNTFAKKERGTAIAVLGIATMVAPAIGPTLGGYIIENLSWRLVFFMNVPIGIAGSIMALLLLAESERKHSSHFDLVGVLTSSTGLGCVLYVLGKGNVDWGNINNIVLMIIGCFSLLMFVVNELMVPEPMLDLRLLKNYTFAMSNIVLNIAVLALFAGVFLVPIFLQQLQGLAPFQTGMVLFPEAIMTAISMVLSGKLCGKLGVRFFAIAGLILLALNSYNMSMITLNTSSTTITLLLMVRGLGVGFLIPPVQLAGLNAVPNEVMSNASALVNTAKQIGTSVGLTIMTSFLQHRSTINYAHLSGQVNAFNPNIMDLLKMLQGLLIRSGAPQSSSQGGALSLLYGIVAKQSLLQALNDTMMLITIITILIILPTLLLKERKLAASEERPMIME